MNHLACLHFQNLRVVAQDAFPYCLPSPAALQRLAISTSIAAKIKAAGRFFDRSPVDARFSRSTWVCMSTAGDSSRTSSSEGFVEDLISVERGPCESGGHNFEVRVPRFDDSSTRACSSNVPITAKRSSDGQRIPAVRFDDVSPEPGFQRATSIRERLFNAFHIPYDAM